MIHSHPPIACSLCILLTLLFASPAWSQDADEDVGSDKPGATKPAAQSAEKPDTKSAEKTPRLQEALATADDSGVAAILATNPKTPVECVRAAIILADLNRADLGKPLLRQVLEAKLPPEQLADLGESLGSALFIAIGGSDALQPDGKFLADAVLAAMAARREDGKRIEASIQQLQDASPDQRFLAMVALQETPLASISPLIGVLADPARSKEHANVRTTLAGMGRLGRDAVMSALVQSDPKLKVQAIQILAEMPGRTTELALLASAFSDKSDLDVRNAASAALKRLCGKLASRQEATEQVIRAARECFDRQQPLEGTVEGKVAMWRWDEGKRCCTVQNCDADDARRELAARWARDAYLLAPDDRNVQRLYLAARLDASQYTQGLDQPLKDDDPALVEAKQMGVKAVEEVLALSLTNGSTSIGHVGAGVAAARLLGQIGNADELLHQGVEPAPLARAVRSPDRRVRMAALKSIVQLHPTKPYPGSSAVPQALAFFAAGSGTRQALAAGPILQQSRDVAGMLASQGLQSEIAATGHELLQLAASSPDYELAMIDVTIVQPQIGILLQQLRHDERTASLRIGLIARAGFEVEAEHAAHSDSLSMAFAKPADEQILQRQLEQLATLAPREFVPAETRLQQAVDALDLLGELSRSEVKLYDLCRAQDAVLKALYTPKLSAKAVEVLVNLNSAASQQSLVNVASQLTLSVELRLAAAKAFRQHTQKHGILLTTDEIRRQYERYNESEKSDVGTQQILGLILDCIEAPTKPNNAKRASVPSP